jgi:hypothetical protein
MRLEKRKEISGAGPIILLILGSLQVLNSISSLISFFPLLSPRSISSFSSSHSRCPHCRRTSSSILTTLIDWVKCGIEDCDGQRVLCLVCCRLYCLQWLVNSILARVLSSHHSQSSSVAIEAVLLALMTCVSFALLISPLAQFTGEVSWQSLKGMVLQKKWTGELVRPFAASVTQQRGWDMWPFTNLSVGPRCLSWSVGWGKKGGWGRAREGKAVECFWSRWRELGVWNELIY